MSLGKVSVIMTVYNKPQWLNEAIDSVVNQTYQDWELLLMEDNSPNPKVREIMESYEDPRIRRWYSDVSESERYLTTRYATLINIGFRISKGDYITYLTDDDFFYPDRLDVMTKALQEPGVDVVYGPQHIVDAEGTPRGVRETKGVLDGTEIRDDDDNMVEDRKAFNQVDHNSVMHIRQAFIDAGGWYDVPGVWAGADAYFWQRLNEAGYTFHPVSDVEHPLEAKRYHEGAVQWMIHNGQFYPDDRVKMGLRPLDELKD